MSSIFRYQQNARLSQQQNASLLPTQQQYVSALTTIKQKPWLISTVSQLAYDRAILDSVRNKWLSACPFDEQPYQNRASKIAWLKGIGTLFNNELRDCNYLYYGPDPARLVAAEFLSRAPQKITLELYCNTANVLDQTTDVDEAVFQQGLPLYGRMDYDGEEMTWGAYSTWLSEQENDSVLFGSMECDKTDDIGEKIVCVLAKLGLDTCFSGATLLNDDELRTPSTFWYSINPNVGENLYYPSNGTAAAVQISVEFRKPTKVDEANLAWRKSLIGLKVQSVEASDPKTFLLVQKAVSMNSANGEELQESDKLNTPETCHALWLHAKFDEEYYRLVGHFAGEGESLDILLRLNKKDIDSKRLTLSIFASELQNIKVKHKKSDWPSKFVTTLALTMVATNDVNWMLDNKAPEETKNQIGRLSKYWRKTLLKKTDADLGLGLPNETADESSIGMSDSRKALYRLLEMRALRIKYISESKLTLNWKPSVVVSKKRKVSPTSVDDIGNFGFAGDKQS